MAHVHFAEGSPMSDGAGPFGDSPDTGVLSVKPVACLTFIGEDGDLTSTVVLTNNDEKTPISYKMKTTSPEKFRVRPSAGVLAPGETISVTLTILPGFQLGGLTSDKFLVMSMPVEHADMTSAEIADLWKNTAGKNIYQHKLRCVQTGIGGSSEITRNGSAIRSHVTTENDDTQMKSLSNNVSRLIQCQSRLHEDIKSLNRLQWINIVLIIVLAIVMFAIGFKSDAGKDSEHDLYKNCPMKA